MTQRSDFRFTPAAIDAASGVFSGYGAVFGNLDSHADVIQRGAFNVSLAAWKAKGRLPRMLLMHGSNGNPFTGDDLPCGIWTSMREDSQGLYVEGQLLALNTDYGRRILSLMKGGALDGLSIGFRVKRATSGRGTTKRWIEEVDLREVSIVDEPSNDLARVASIKEKTASERADEAAEQFRASLRGLALPAVIDNSEALDAAAALAARMKAYSQEIRGRR
ncbi:MULTISPECIES: HK97 family phage prohead protease [unclassified Mesorhizobium]|uniref:HK97 family phage prohead protease n=1 Tax=unclassified Mesorhizobium TaxID=325217 RepID=UPI003014C5C8